MKILYLSNFFPPYVKGGAELLAFEMAKAFAIEHEVMVVSTCAPGDEGIDNTYGFPVYRFFPWNVYWNYIAGKRFFLRKLFWHFIDAWNPYSLYRLLKIMRSYRPDILHTHNVDGFSASVWVAARLLKIPVVHTAHDGHFLCPKANFMHSNQQLDCGSAFCSMYRRWHLRMTGLINVFCSPSHFLLNVHQERGLRSKKSVVIPNGVQWESDEPASKKDNGYKNLLFIGSLDSHKGFDLLLEALKSRQDKNWCLDIAGTGPMSGLAEKSAAASGGKINYHGFCSGENKRRLFQKADVVIVPSLCFENFPTVIIEAYRSGLPVLGTDRGGITELIDAGKTGFLFAPNAENLGKAIDKFLLLSTEELFIMRKNCLQKGLKFAFSNMFEAYFAIYRGLLNNENSR